MPIKKTSFSEMTRNSLRYLSKTTGITYFSQGSISKALVEATNLEISRLQDFVSTTFDNSFISTANGLYLDLFGEMLGVPRISDRNASTTINDSAIRFYVDSGTLGSRLPSITSPGRGLIPKGTTITNSEGTVLFTVSSNVLFPTNVKSVFVPVTSEASGSSSNVGANQLTRHSLSTTEVKVTNDISITTGTDVETDSEYRFRLAKAMTTRFGANASAIQVVASSQPGVSRVELQPFARGAGTFDVLLIPQGNRLADSVKQNTRRAVESVVAFGISPRIVEPEYVNFCITVQLRYIEGTAEGQKAASRAAAESAILRYVASIPIGGELIINQLRAAVLGSNSNIKDMKIIELCLDGNHRVISNIKLNSNELLVPDSNSPDSIKVV
jgi:uncharacterized phage protein gp47/JayE